MPNYSDLRPRNWDKPFDLEEKKRTTEKLIALREAIQNHFDEQILEDGVALPSDHTKVLRLATWNIREFDSNKYGTRLNESFHYIAEILSHFDLIAVQEVRDDMKAVSRVKHLLGPSWSSLATDVTDGSAGNGERMVFLFNRNRVWFREVVGELTLPDGQKVTDPFGERFQIEGGPTFELPNGETLASPMGLSIKTDSKGPKLNEHVELALPEGTKLTLPAGTSVTFAKGSRLDFTADGAIDLPTGLSPDLPAEAIIKLPSASIVGGPLQFARTPFVASFQAGWLKLNLCTVHIYYGDEKEGSEGMARRNEEIQRLTALLSHRASNDNNSDADAYFVALGDFNIVGRGHETMESLESNEFMVPKALSKVPGSNVKKDKLYDQIAFWTGESKRRAKHTRMQVYRAGVFDFFETVFRLEDEDTYRPLMAKTDGSGFYDSFAAWRTHQMSDHLPMWVELHVDFSQEYLEAVSAEIDAKIVS